MRSATPCEEPGEAANYRLHGHLRDQRHSDGRRGLPDRRCDALGRLASGSLMARPPPTAFELGIRRFGFLILRLTVFLVLFVLAVQRAVPPALARIADVRAGARGRPDAGAAADGRHRHAGARRDAAGAAPGDRQAAGRHPRLGAMDVLCTDKTGTLTEAKIRLVAPCRSPRRGQRARCCGSPI